MAIEQNQKKQPGNAALPLSLGLSFILPPASSRTLPLAIANGSETDVDWMAAVTAAVGVADWLKLDRDSGHIRAGEVQTLEVTANSKSMHVGDGHEATVTLTPQGQGMQPAHIAVNLQVCLTAYDDAGPHIAIVNPVAVGSQTKGQQDETYTRFWHITNPTSNGQVTWTVNAGEVAWVTKIDPEDGTLPAGGDVIIVVTIDPTLAQGAGKYRTDLVLTFAFADPNKAGLEPTSALIPLTITVPKA